MAHEANPNKCNGYLFVAATKISNFSCAVFTVRRGKHHNFVNMWIQAALNITEMYKTKASEVAWVISIQHDEKS